MTDPAGVAYSPLPARPRLAWPDGKRLAVYVAPNLEVYEYLPEASPHRDPWPRMPHPDIHGYGSRDYGNRVGVWRLFDLMDRHELRCTASLSLAICDEYPQIFAACEQRGWDYMGHGMYNTRYLYGLSEEREREAIADCVATFRRHTGRQLEGWLSPALTFTANTPDLVAEAGISFYCDWLHDDQPCRIPTRHGTLVSLPYSMEVNDTVLHRQGHEAPEFCQVVKGAFDTLYREPGMVLGIAVHPYVSGQPHWIEPLDEALAYVTGHDDVWLTTGSEIARWYADHVDDPVSPG
jgi:allantoinase